MVGLNAMMVVFFIWWSVNDCDTVFSTEFIKTTFLVWERALNSHHRRLNIIHFTAQPKITERIKAEQHHSHHLVLQTSSQEEYLFAHCQSLMPSVAAIVSVLISSMTLLNPLLRICLICGFAPKIDATAPKDLRSLIWDAASEEVALLI